MVFNYPLWWCHKGFFSSTRSQIPSEIFVCFTFELSFEIQAEISGMASSKETPFENILRADFLSNVKKHDCDPVRRSNHLILVVIPWYLLYLTDARSWLSLTNSNFIFRITGIQQLKRVLLESRNINSQQASEIEGMTQKRDQMIAEFNA